MQNKALVLVPDTWQPPGARGRCHLITVASRQRHLVHFHFQVVLAFFYWGMCYLSNQKWSRGC